MMKKILLLAIIVITFGGCATDSDSDRLSLDDMKDKVASLFGQATSTMNQAKSETQGLEEEQYRASPKF